MRQILSPSQGISDDSFGSLHCADLAPVSFSVMHFVWPRGPLKPLALYSILFPGPLLTAPIVHALLAIKFAHPQGFEPERARRSSINIIFKRRFLTFVRKNAILQMSRSYIFIFFALGWNGRSGVRDMSSALLAG